MALVRSIKRRMQAAAPAAVFLSLVAYFAWNSLRGDLGLHAYERRKADLVAADADLAAAQAERDAWQSKVAAMQPAHLDTDALDERARQLLNLSAPSDIVVPLSH
jgi:cell division protein FtsB